VVGECLKLCGPVAARLGAALELWWKELVLINRAGLPPSVTDYRRECEPRSVGTALLNILEEIKQLGERDLATAAGSEKRRDVSLFNPAIQAGIADSQQSGCRCTAYRRANGLLEVSRDGENLAPSRIISDTGSTAEAKNILDELFWFWMLRGHPLTIAEKVKKRRKVFTFQ